MLAQDEKEADDDLSELLKYAFDGDDDIGSGDAVGISLSAEDEVEESVSGCIETLPSDIDLSKVIQDTIGDHGLDAFQLLNDVEAMETGDISLEQAAQAEEDDLRTAVESDHQYSQLCNVEVKPHETKKQAVRRVKNNAASKVCRRQRKNKFATNVQEIERLTKANDDLKQSITGVQAVVDLLREHLVHATRK